MRLLFPVMLVVAVLFMLVTSLVSAALALILPILLVLVGVAVILGLRGIRFGIELMRLGFQLLGHAFGYVADVFRLLFVSPDVELELTDSAFPPLVARLSSPQFPEFHRMQESVAAELGLKPAEELWISPDTALGITTAKRDGRRIRCLVIGLELVRSLPPDQLRAALFHEFGHERGGDLWLGRWARHLILKLIEAAEGFHWLNPARWSAELSLGMVKLSYLPWSRAKEYAADDWAARYAGPRVLAESLRTVRRESPPVELALVTVLQMVSQQRRAPVRLGEAVRRFLALIPATERHRMGMRNEGDPLDLGGRTHPSIALRIAALSKHAQVAPTHVAPFDAERLAQLDERLTKMWLDGVGVSRLVPVDEFLEPQKEEPAALPDFEPELSDFPQPEPEMESADARFLPPGDDDAPIELDTDRDWLKRRK